MIPGLFLRELLDMILLLRVPVAIAFAVVIVVTISNALETIRR